MIKSQNIYDDQNFFDGYKTLRENQYSANNREEKPALFSLAPELQGRSVLDLGCGYGENCAKFKEMGAARVLGVDLSEKMLAVAAEQHPYLDFMRGDMSDLSFVKGQFDVVFSSLALHYIEDFPALARQVISLLTDGGYFIFSEEHPLTTAPIRGDHWTKDDDGNVIHYNLSDYARSGKRIIQWIVDGVEKYHRTFSEIVNALADAGFIIEKMLEPTPSAEDLLRDITLEKSFHKPNFLLIRARKA